jgi:predicted ABC-type transport system involved in lysophospholipase L1 biosynthesis ATPase subunit
MPDTIIRLAGLTREYRMDAETVYALRGVDLAIDRNEYVAVMGLLAQRHRGLANARRRPGTGAEP